MITAACILLQCCRHHSTSFHLSHQPINSSKEAIKHTRPATECLETELYSSSDRPHLDPCTSLATTPVAALTWWVVGSVFVLFFLANRRSLVVLPTHGLTFPPRSRRTPSRGAPFVNVSPIKTPHSANIKARIMPQLRPGPPVWPFSLLSPPQACFNVLKPLPQDHFRRRIRRFPRSLQLRCQILPRGLPPPFLRELRNELKRLLINQLC